MSKTIDQGGKKEVAAGSPDVPVLVVADGCHVHAGARAVLSTSNSRPRCAMCGVHIDAVVVSAYRGAESDLSVLDGDLSIQFGGLDAEMIEALIHRYHALFAAVSGLELGTPWQACSLFGKGAPAVATAPPVTLNPIQQAESRLFADMLREELSGRATLEVLRGALASPDAARATAAVRLLRQDIARKPAWFHNPALAIDGPIVELAGQVRAGRRARFCIADATLERAAAELMLDALADERVEVADAAAAALTPRYSLRPWCWLSDAHRARARSVLLRYLERYVERGVETSNLACEALCNTMLALGCDELERLRSITRRLEQVARSRNLFYAQALVQRLEAAGLAGARWPEGPRTLLELIERGTPTDRNRTFLIDALVRTRHPEAIGWLINHFDMQDKELIREHFRERWMRFPDGVDKYDCAGLQAFWRERRVGWSPLIEACQDLHAAKYPELAVAVAAATGVHVQTALPNDGEAEHQAQRTAMLAALEGHSEVYASETAVESL